MPGKIIFFARYTNRVIGTKTNARLNDLNYSVLYNDPEFIAPVANGGFQVFKSMHAFSIHNMLWTAVDNANSVSHVGWGPPSGTATWAGVTGRCANYVDCTHISYNLLTPYGVQDSANYYFKIRNEGAASNTTLGSYFVVIFYCDNNVLD